MALKPIPKGNKGLPKLPKKVRNKMGFMKDGGLAEATAKLKARGGGAATKGLGYNVRPN